jgi:hypothetical protein
MATATIATNAMPSAANLECGPTGSARFCGLTEKPKPKTEHAAQSKIGAFTLEWLRALGTKKKGAQTAGALSQFR